MRSEYDFSKAERDAVIPLPGKTRITIMLDNDVLEPIRSRAEAEGRGHQTAIKRAKPQLALMRCDRSALEKKIRALLLTFGPHEEIVAAVDKLKPRGNLTLTDTPFVKKSELSD